MSIVERGKCKIVTLNDKGLGVSHSKSAGIQLPYTIPGEEVSFERHSYRGISNCILKEIITPSSERIEAPCRYFGACGGCLLQHINNEGHNKFKRSLVEDALSRADITTDINPLITIPQGQRRRAILEAVKKDDQVFLGFRRFQSNQIININECIALLPELSSLLPNLKSLLLKILAHKQKAKIFLTKAATGIDLALEIKGQNKLLSEQRFTLSQFAKENALIKLTFQDELGSNWDIVHKVEEPYIKFDDIPVEIDARSFLQATFASDQILAELVVKPLQHKYTNSAYIADLFCGRGTLTLPLSKYYKVDSFDSSKEAVKVLNQAAKKFVRQVDAKERDLFLSPLNWNELNKYEAVVLNPPRGGAKNQIESLQNSTVKTICYVSCNPESFARDAKILLKGHYQLIEVTPVDQFYWTPHIELVGVFQRL